MVMSIITFFGFSPVLFHFSASINMNNLSSAEQLVSHLHRFSMVQFQYDRLSSSDVLFIATYIERTIWGFSFPFICLCYPDS